MRLKDIPTSSREHGAVFVELAITLPITVALLFLVYWAFLASGWRSAVATAVYTGVDLAGGRGDPVALGVATTGNATPTGMMPALDALANSNTWNGSILGTNGAAGLLTSGNITGTPATIYLDYTKQAGRWPSKTTFDAFPRRTYYAMAFAYQNLRATLPGDTKFPCDPDQPDNFGCLICVPAHPGMLGIAQSDPVPPNRFGIECRYRPSTALFTAIAKILDANIDSVVIRHARGYEDGLLDSF